MTANRETPTPAQDPSRFDEHGHAKYVEIAVHKDWLDICHHMKWAPMQILDYLVESFRTGTDIQPTMTLTFDEHMAELKQLPTELIQHSREF